MNPFIAVAVLVLLVLLAAVAVWVLLPDAPDD